MTSKEALDTLKKDLGKHYLSETAKDLCYKAIEKDLEVLEQYKDIEEKTQWNELGIDLITLFKIVSFDDQKIWVDENKVGTFYEKDKWKRVKCFIPVSFNISFIYCDVWYEDNFGGVMDNLVIPISEYKKTWALTKKELE